MSGYSDESLKLKLVDFLILLFFILLVAAA